MSTRERFETTEINGRNRLFSPTKTIIETAFYGNNVQAVTDLKMAYELAKKSPKTIVTDQPIKHTSELGLPKDAVMLVDNHGRIVGRTAAARKILGRPGVDNDELEAVLREAVYQGNERQFYQAQAIVGLDEEFMLKAHLMVPKGYEVNLLSYLLNFQILDSEYAKRYAASKAYSEDDIYLYCDPEWNDPQYPDGLALFDPEHNVAAILGLRYFGELKKATLTLAWATAHRNGYTACHGGEKTFHFKDKEDKVFAFYGLSGSGKSTLTHAKHAGKFDDITILHDDAFIIDRKDGSSIALEPAYFDKTSDYLPGSKEMEYFTTVMNVGVTQDMQGKKILVTDDLRNGNGRTIKSRYSAKNRVDREQAPLDSIFWIMKDDSLPPVVKLSDPVIAATFGLTLATKRSTAENVIGESRNKLVIEPFANPFRVYPLTEDYQDFKELFEKQQANCYIINTDSYNGKNIDKDTTLGILEAIANETADWTEFGALPQMSYLSLPGYEVDLNDTAYAKKLRQRLQDRLDWVNNYTKTHPQEELPVEITTKLEELVAKLG
ncbi:MULTISPECIES: phosphoenolpyruvate carboxykinase (ATP) [Ligilactobacillus]|uniref:phosphoenolpyruvate carboxykinase (ATP) n=1 Tax=Ligilactobacillus animalis TaxID=1605 RepID=A0ABR4RM72_9LACO|nr:phosphoenolpyruvate carboxykinase (ATP) [Ligilactobacillus animalis]KDA45215.1 phosphoenolpyruvate carboxykinase (ATP), pckA [Ligilactobacillus animalis]KRM57249.1 phosphoenolpyruvate carboxykinase [Ligilactobacillus animalis KCTC 3501 = DSM 20602]MBU5279931.1 phosphoenolpyruvate carboxykinase (ATP) [Ligilactobacillus animalis]MDO5883741.1 phosphoenolpyruvate carboxykinase (ATP) [Ligilactobacillus animalis]MDU1488093.1 phosphoenolpyruvate carboxykinase (ATP) [Ligilactobacillus animalis]